ncbi:hypothetical protein CANCADRAFT_30620 [Tortispora caseinolytica NRRL Y-17796]|uniref:Aminopeptidase n=1 Tax=Tortispora caseinolytica NRRL Y-17796 TaxID=767744 RepID=A0A1E4TL55_9ASCO|nr:hypothetical protein CANCADRAFT_30620 [Tortispora caseinolytica NRRL Y-17796]
MATIDNLPKNVTPVHYDLCLWALELNNTTFDGAVNIQLIVNEPTEKIVLNAKNLTISKAKLTYEFNKTVCSVDATVELDADKEIAIISLPEKLPSHVSTANLSLEYQGKINTDMTGFYRSLYTEASTGKPTSMISTQFEATDARAALPCFDEPALKATFSVALVVPENLTAISNMPILSSKAPEDGKKKGISDKKALDGVRTKVVTFEKTPKMSTYLLGWVIGDLEYIEGFTERSYNGKPLPIRVYTTRGLVHQAEFALSYAPRIVDYFSEIFGIDYMIPKLDLVAVHEFSHGAMENWGLLTYRTTTLLFDPKTSDERYKSIVSYVVAHEIAHQWFGNLVTMNWWNELWLNEGFATFIGWKAIEYLNPEWEVFTNFTADALQSALSLDSLRQSHPIEVFVKSAKDIDQVFDHISYLKGSSTIRMIANHLSIETFLAGVSAYLKKFSYSNATTKDLWTSLSEISGTDVNTLMDSWIGKIGYPYVTVKEDGSVITVEQHRFLASGDATNEEDETVWWIPLSIKSTDSANIAAESQVLLSRSATIAGIDPEFYKLNFGQTGVYRVNYPESRLVKLATQRAELSASDRIGLVGDAFALATAGIAPTTAYLSFVEGAKTETSFSVWSLLESSLSEFSTAFYSCDELQKSFSKFWLSLVSPSIEKLGWDSKEGESFLTGRLRALIICRAGMLGHESVISRARELLEGPSDGIKPSLRQAIWSTVLSNATDDDTEIFESIMKEQSNSSSIDAREIALVALGRVTAPKLIEKAKALLLSSQIAVQDIHYLSSTLASNPAIIGSLWPYIKEHWSEITERFTGIVLDRFVKVTLNKFTDLETVEDIEKFFADKDTTSYARSLGQSLDRCKANAQWVSRDEKSVNEWLKKRGY